MSLLGLRPLLLTLMLLEMSSLHMYEGKLGLRLRLLLRIVTFLLQKLSRPFSCNSFCWMLGKEQRSHLLSGCMMGYGLGKMLMIRSFLLLKNMLDNYFFLPARCLIVFSRSTACKRHGRRLFLPAPLLPILPCYPNAHTALGEVGADGSLSGIILLPNLATDKPLSGNFLATLTELASVPALAGANAALSPWSTLKMIWWFF